MFCCLRVVTFLKAVVDNALIGGFETVDGFEEADIAGIGDLFVNILLAFVVVDLFVEILLEFVVGESLDDILLVFVVGDLFGDVLLAFVVVDLFKAGTVTADFDVVVT